MPITRKPKTPDPSLASSVDIEALINRGGSVALPNVAETQKAEKAYATVNLRLPPSLLTQIDASLDGRRVKTPRHTWILEALLEKLEREEQGKN